jgi:putative tricarboxylic transport membrane protein
MVAGRPRARAEIVLSVGVLTLGVVAAVIAFRLPETSGYARIGPNFMPKFVAAGLVVCGLWLLAEVLTGGWRDAVPDNPLERGDHAPRRRAFGWVTAGLFAQMALIPNAGFVLAAGALFTCVARGFGSTRPLRDLAGGLIMGTAVFLFFVKFLNVNLPAGWLQPLLGAAGI